MVLAHLFLKAKFPFSIAHVNFGLRIPDANLDLDLVKEFCETNSITAYFHLPETTKYAEEKGISIQMAARELRYHFFEKCMVENHLNYLITAHHSSDNLENFFIYLLRNNTEGALKGIAKVSGNRIRPMLDFTKQEIVNYATANNITWREDSSNLKTDYLRNKVRNLIIPGLMEYYPEAGKDFLYLSMDFQNYFENKKKNAEEFLKTYWRSDGNKKWISAEILQHNMGSAALNYFFREKGFHKNTIAKMLASKRIGSKFSSALADVMLEPAGFCVMDKESKIQEVEFIISETDLPLQIEAGKFEITLEEKPLGNEGGEFGEYWQFDMDKLKFPLVIRTWKIGDKMEIFGSGKHKKLSDILIDAKVGISSKNLHPVLDSSAGILGLTALKRSNLAKVSGESKRILAIKWHIQNI